MSSPGPLDRLRQAQRLLRTEGRAGIAARFGDRIAAKVSPPGQVRLPVSKDDLRRAGEIAERGWRLPPALAASADEPLTIAWICVPPGGPGSGGHTTMFRLVAMLEARRSPLRALHDRPARLVDRPASPEHPRLVAAHQGRRPRRRGRHRGRARDLRHGLADRVHAAGVRSQGRALLPRPGLRALVLSGRQRGAARRSDLPVRFPCRHRRTLARRAPVARLRDAGRPFRLRRRPRPLHVGRVRPADRGLLLRALQQVPARLRARRRRPRAVRRASPRGRHPLLRR